MRRIKKRKIEVFREPIRFKKTFFETGPPFEDPRLPQLRVSINACKHPTEYIIFFDHMWIERQSGGDVKDFTAINHGVVRVTMFGESRDSSGISAGGRDMRNPVWLCLLLYAVNMQ